MVAKLIGGAGTGKTTELMRIMGQVIQRGIDPFEIGFCSFTKTAVMEAAQRVEDEFGASAEQLTKQGWFRTLHSVCYQSLGPAAKGLLTDKKADREWLEEVLQEHVGEVVKTIAADAESGVRALDMAASSPAANALRIWAMARSRLLPIEDVVAELVICGESPPAVAYCQKIAAQYERSKYLDDRLDFADLAGRFAGWRWNPHGDHDFTVAEQGEPPPCRVWFFDEHQDVSQLLHSVARRLMQSPTCTYAYLSGDPFQSIFSFGGADMGCFMDQEADKTRIMERSYRCPESVLRLGEKALSRCSNYFDRGIAPNAPGGDVSFSYQYRDLLDRVDLSGSLMLIARTGMMAASFTKALNERAVPWTQIGTNASFLSTREKEICFFFSRIEKGLQTDRWDGNELTGDQWRSIVKFLPAGKGDDALLARGTKAKATSGELAKGMPAIIAADLPGLGATDRLMEMIASGQWVSLVKGGERFKRSLAKFGEERVWEPSVRIGTIHAAKGGEADTVILLDSLTRRCHLSKQLPAGRDEEQRIAYVGITRARKSLHVLRQRSDRWRMEID